MRAVIFDFDGTLVDTMPHHFIAYRRAFADFGVELTEHDFYSNVGGSARESIPKFLRGRACAASTEEIHRHKKMLIGEVFRTGLITVLETAKLLPVFHPLLPMALASSGSREGIEILLERLDWRRYFKLIITGDDVVHGKPAPETFLRAAEGLGVQPSACFAFEDTDAGVAAAQAAGMPFFDVRRTASSQSGKS